MRHNKLMDFIYFFIIIIESIHSILHLLVLLGYLKVNQNQTFRKFYFGFDLSSVIFSYLILKANGFFVMIHLIIHIGAVFHLFIKPIDTYNWIFEIGEQKWNNHSKMKHVIYILGTFEDILTHSLNVYSSLVHIHYYKNPCRI